MLSSAIVQSHPDSVRPASLAIRLNESTSGVAGKLNDGISPAARLVKKSPASADGVI